MEQWKDIKGCEGRYQISNKGRVKSLPRFVDNHTGELLVKEKILSQRHNKNGYMVIDLKYNDGTKKYKLVHRLVAQAFIPNNENKPQVNHIDGNKENNDSNNLEWCTNGENQIHAYKNGLNYVTGRAGKKRKEVAKIDINTGEIICVYKSIADAARKNDIKNSSNIGMCCMKLYGRKTIGGYRWEYMEGENNG